MEVTEQKKELRKQIKKIKNEYSLIAKQELSLPIFNHIEKFEEFHVANCIVAYWSMDDEVFTHDFINKWYKDKTILLPCVNGNDLILRKYEGKESMIVGEQFGILEPNGKIYDDYSIIDLIIIPGVAFDTKKNRMGRGRGFYDRLLKICNCKKIGVCFDFQLIENVPTEEFDVKMDTVISTTKIY